MLKKRKIWGQEIEEKYFFRTEGEIWVNFQNHIKLDFGIFENEFAYKNWFQDVFGGDK